MRTVCREEPRNELEIDLRRTDDSRPRCVAFSFLDWRGAMSFPLTFAVLCESCDPPTIFDSRETRGEICPVCQSRGSLLSLARVLNPTPELGKITFIHA